MATDISANSKCPESQQKLGKQELKDLLDRNELLMTPSFQIRHFVCTVRERDFNKCWPFRTKILERCESIGVTPSLPPFLPPVSLHHNHVHGGTDLSSLHYQRYDPAKAVSDALRDNNSPAASAHCTTLSSRSAEIDHFSAETKVSISNPLNNTADNSYISEPEGNHCYQETAPARSQSLGETMTKLQSSHTSRPQQDLSVHMEICGDGHVYDIDHQPRNSAGAEETNISVGDLQSTAPGGHNDLDEGQKSESVGSLEHVESITSKQPVLRYEQLSHEYPDTGPVGTKDTGNMTENMDAPFGYCDSTSDADHLHEHVNFSTVANGSKDTIDNPDDRRCYNDILGSDHPKISCSGHGNQGMVMTDSDPQSDSGQIDKFLVAVGTNIITDDKNLTVKNSGIQMGICQINTECSDDQLLDFKTPLEPTACLGSRRVNNSDVVSLDHHHGDDISFDPITSAKICNQINMVDHSMSHDPVSDISSHDIACSESHNIALKDSNSQSDVDMMERFVSASQTEASQCLDFMECRGAKISSDYLKSNSSSINMIATSDYSETENSVEALATDLENAPTTKEPPEAHNFKSLKLLISGNGCHLSQEDSTISSNESSKPSSNQSCLVATTAKMERNKSREDSSCIAQAPETLMPQVCPVCLNFTSTSNTALNAHMDHCLEIVLPDDDREGRTCKNRIKPRKMRSMVEICASAPARTLEDLERSTKLWDLNDKNENDTNCSLIWTSRPVRRQPRTSVHRNKGKSNLEIEGILRKEEFTQEQEQRKGEKIRYRHPATACCGKENQEMHEVQHERTTTETEVTIETLAEVPHPDSETMQVPFIDDALKPRQLGFPAHTAKSRMARKRKKNGLSNLVSLWDVSTSGDATQHDDNHEVDFEQWEPLNLQDFTLIDTSADYEQELQQKFTSSGRHELESLQHRILEDFPKNARRRMEMIHDYSDSFVNEKPRKVIGVDRKPFHEDQKNQKLSPIDFSNSHGTLESVEERDQEGHSSCTPRQRRLFPKIKSLLTLVATTKNMDEGNTEKGSDQRTLDLEITSINCPRENALVCENTGISNGDSFNAGQIQSPDGAIAMNKLVDGHPDQNAESFNATVSCPDETHHCTDENEFNDGDLNTLQGTTEFLRKSVVNEHISESNENAEQLINIENIMTMQTPLIHPTGMGHVDGNTNVVQKPSALSSDAASAGSMKSTYERNEISVTGSAISADANDSLTGNSAARSYIVDASRMCSSPCSDSSNVLGVTGEKRKRIETSSDKVKNKEASIRECFETQHVSVGMHDRQEKELCRKEHIFRKPLIGTDTHINISTPSIGMRTGRYIDNCERGDVHRVVAGELDQMLEPMSQNVDSCFPREKFSTCKEKFSTSANLSSDFAGNTENNFDHVKDFLRSKSSISADLQSRAGNAIQQTSRDFYKNHYLDLTGKDWINNPSMNGDPVQQPFYAHDSIFTMKGNLQANIVSEHLINASSLNSRKDYSSESTTAARLGVHNSVECTSDQGVVHIFGNPVFKLMGQNVIVTNDKMKSYGNPHGQNGAKKFDSSGLHLETYLHCPQSQTVQNVLSSNHEVCKVRSYSFMDSSRESHPCMLNNFPFSNIRSVDLSAHNRDVATANPHISGLVPSERTTVVSQSFMDKFKSNHVNRLPVEVFGSSLGNYSIDTQQNRMELTPGGRTQLRPWNEMHHSLKQLQLKSLAYPTETPDRL